MTGVFLISYIGSSEEHANDFPDELKGNFYMLGSAFAWGLYEVLYKKFIGDAKLDVSKSILLTFVILYGSSMFDKVTPVINFSSGRVPDIYQYFFTACQHVHDGDGSCQHLLSTVHSRYSELHRHRTVRVSII